MRILDAYDCSKQSHALFTRKPDCSTSDSLSDDK